MKLKINLLLLVLTAGAFCSAFSQGNGPLLIQVKGPNVADVKFIFQDKMVLGSLETGDLKIKLDDREKRVKRIGFMNLVGNNNELAFTGNLQKVLSITGRKLDGNSLAQNFKIKVYLSDTTVADIDILKPLLPDSSVEGSRNAGAETETETVSSSFTTTTDERRERTTPGAYKVGSMINDASMLSIPGTPKALVLKILAYYARVNEDWDQVETAYRGNVHLHAAVLRKKNTVELNSNVITDLLGKVGGLDVTTLALGFTDFIIKRGKEELNIKFFQDFQAFLGKPEYKDLKTMFPSTWQTLDFIGTEIYNYNRYLQSLQTAFKNDLKQLTLHLPTVIDNHTEYFNMHPALKASLRTGIYITQRLRDGVHPGEIIDGYDATLLDGFGTNVPGMGAGNPDFKTAVQLIQLLSFALRNQTNNKAAYWIDPGTVHELFNNRSVLTCFLGLLYQQGRSRFGTLNFEVDGHTIDILGSLNNTTIFGQLNEWERYITTLSAKGKTLNELIADYKDKKASLNVEQLSGYFQASVDLLQYAAQITTLPGLQIPGFEQHFSVYFETARAFSALLADVDGGQYKPVITDALRIYSLIYEHTVTTLQEKIDDPQTPAATVTGLKAQLKQAENTRTLIKKVFHYGTFMAAVADADTPEKVSDAIEAFALPSGSSRIKRESPFNVSLNAYAGLFGGYERILGLASDKKFKLLNAYGLTVPIGVAISTSRNHWSYSAFISLVDLGAVAAYRLQNDSVNEVPSIQLKDIFSPGLFLSVGIPKSPISLNLGAQVGPNLRKVTTTANDYSGSTYLRFSLSVLIDIPLLNFYTRSKD